MAKPDRSTKQKYFFRHDEYARSGLLMQAMVAKHGMAGYGRYWVLMEIMRSEPGYGLRIKDDRLYGVIRKDLRCSEGKARQFVDCCINEFHLFETDGETMWSESLMENMKFMEKTSAIGRMGGIAKRDKAAEIAQNRGEGIKPVAGTHCVPDAEAAQSKESIGDEQHIEMIPQEERKETPQEHSDPTAQETMGQAQNVEERPAMAAPPSADEDDMRYSTYTGDDEHIYDTVGDLMVTYRQREDLMMKYDLTEEQFEDGLDLVKKTLATLPSPPSYRCFFEDCIRERFNRPNPENLSDEERYRAYMGS